MAHLTYLLYIVFWEALVWGGCAYVVFVLGQSAGWFWLAMLLSFMAYSPKRWGEMVCSKPSEDA